MIRASIVGGSGYTGGELLRLLHFHPNVDVTQITSREHAGHYVHTVHPTMRDVCRLQFVHPDALEPAMCCFWPCRTAAPPATSTTMPRSRRRIIDLSADFRLNDPDDYVRWYGETHPAPEWLPRFVYGLPELQRETLRGAHYASGVGCNATALNLALSPLAQAGLIANVSASISVGSSEGGASVNDGSHHPVRSGAVRTYSATGHRHLAEVRMMLGTDAPIRFSVTAIEMVRGVHLLAHVDLTEARAEKDVWKLYRAAYNDEPFVRLVSGEQACTACRSRASWPEPIIATSALKLIPTTTATSLWSPRSTTSAKAQQAARCSV